MQRMELGKTYILKNAIIVVYPQDMMEKANMSLFYKFQKIEEDDEPQVL